VVYEEDTIFLIFLLIDTAYGFPGMGSNTTTIPIDSSVPTAGKFATLNKPNTYESGKVKITEFLKFNCGHCYSLNSQLPDLKKKYGDRLEITYKPMLWRSVPADLAFKKSIEAYILANRAGKGEEMKDALFKAMFVENKDITSELQLGDIGKSIGLGDEFVTALKNGDAIDETDANINLAESMTVDETPTIIINGNLKVTPSMTNADATQMANNQDTIINSLLGSLTPAVTSTIYVTPIATPVLTSTITQSTTVTAVATSTKQISVTIPPTVKENAQINWTLMGGGAILVILLGGVLLRMRKSKDDATRGRETVKSDIHVSDDSDFKSDIKTS
jgi:thiol:disulfide interchange protein DsbA